MNQTIDSRIHIALSPGDLTDDYNRHAGTTLLSILKNSSSPITAHILYNKNLSLGKERQEEYTIQCYQNITDKYNCELEFHHVDFPEWINNHPITRHFPESALMRLVLPNILQDISRIVYFDCDLIVLTDVSKLWSIPLNKYYIAASTDRDIIKVYTKYKEAYDSAEINIDNYFNSGVLVLNIERIREDSINLVENALNFLFSHPHLPYPDQDFLNAFFGKSYYQLDEKYNQFSTRIDYSDTELNDIIIHYAGPTVKPWKRYNGKIDEIYWHYLSLTPWAENGKITEYLSPILKNSDDIIQELPDTIWEFPFYNKIKTLWKLTLPLWIKLIIRYMKS